MLLVTINIRCSAVIHCCYSGDNREAGKADNCSYETGAAPATVIGEIHSLTTATLYYSREGYESGIY